MTAGKIRTPEGPARRVSFSELLGAGDSDGRLCLISRDFSGVSRRADRDSRASRLHESIDICVW
jgi:hypothetical protein